MFSFAVVIEIIFYENFFKKKEERGCEVVSPFSFTCFFTSTRAPILEDYVLVQKYVNIG